MSDTTIVGNVTRDPDLRFTASGAAVASFGIAVNRRWQKGGEWQEATSFFDVSCWGSLAENVTQSIAKGTRAVVVGRLEQQSWETDDGSKRSKVQIVADEVSPSLRWATCEVSKTERSGHSTAGRGNEQAGADPEDW